ncbi:hypothetical protein GCM10010430_30440 [Kitasatospora cystarginea]|uniref:Uncharacterized protein n=1 Tax=Kitasatospora cystarginea TaxID=58350 RepID=A0ABN3E187_9ACTN
MAEPKYYTTAEKARLAYIVGKAALAAGRGKDLAKYDAQIDRIQQAAIEREKAEQAAKKSANHWT